jgi:hypothetical protein
MAMLIVLVRGDSVELKVGESMPMSVYFDPSNVLFVQLSGHELDYAQTLLPGLPKVATRKVANYVGDWAKMIVMNWDVH